MTMPHLMNCAHQDAGWCLECVGELHAKVEALEKNYQPSRATQATLRGMAARGMARPQIAAELGYSEGYINRLLTRHGIRTSGRVGRKPAPKAAAPIRKKATHALPSAPANWLSGLGG